MNFEDIRRERLEQINKIIELYLPAEQGFQAEVEKAMNYSVRAGGKRLRPMLMQETFRLFGGDSKVVEPFMAAIELIHTHSLVHDDLPAMDNDEYRRGRKTTHVVFGEAMGILAGDGLLNLAYETASRAFLMDPGNPHIGRAIGVLAGKAGIYGMLGGQSVDVKSAGESVSKEKLDFIYRLKTGALIEGAMMTGAILACAPEEKVEAAGRVAACVGMAFQIQDDILDVTSTAEELGKPINSDERNKKTTYVTIAGLERARQDVKEISKRALDVLDGLEEKNEFLRELILQLINRKN